MNAKYKALIAGIANAEDRDQRAPDFTPGRHEVILAAYSITDSKQNMGAIIRAEFVLQSGQPAGFAWFPNAQGWAGTFSQQDAKAFLNAVKLSLGSDEELDAIAESLLDEEQHGRGIRLIVDTWQASKDGKLLTTKKGQPIIRAKWTPVEQTLDDVAATRAQLDDGSAMSAPPVAAEPEPTPAAATPAPAPAKKGLFGRKTAN